MPHRGPLRGVKYVVLRRNPSVSPHTWDIFVETHGERSDLIEQVPIDYKATFDERIRAEELARDHAKRLGIEAYEDFAGEDGTKWLS